MFGKIKHIFLDNSKGDDPVQLKLKVCCGKCKHVNLQKLTTFRALFLFSGISKNGSMQYTDFFYFFYSLVEDIYY